MQPDLEKLTTAVREHIRQVGLIDGEAFDAMLLEYGFVATVPSVMDPARGSHTRTRDLIRKKVASELKRQGYALVLDRKRAGYTIEDAMVAGMQRITKLPPELQRMLEQRAHFIESTWKNGWSELAKLLPPEIAKVLKEELDYTAARTAHDMQRTLWFIFRVFDDEWPQPIRAVLPQKPGPVVKRRRKRKAS